MIVATNRSFAGFRLLVPDVFNFGAGGAFGICRNGLLCINGQERLEVEKQFASKEFGEEARKEPAKKFTPGEFSTPLETPIEDQVPKFVAPTPEQILAIKVHFMPFT